MFRLVRLLFLLLGAGLALLWIRSRSINELVIFSIPGHRYIEIATIPDQFRVTVVDNWPIAVPLRHMRSKSMGRVWPVFGQGPIYSNWLRFGFALNRGSRQISPPTWGPGYSGNNIVTYSQLAMIFALPVAACALIGFWPLLRRVAGQRRQRDRLAKGFCPQCGYDLRASSQRCPECGLVI